VSRRAIVDGLDWRRSPGLSRLRAIFNQSVIDSYFRHKLLATVGLPGERPMKAVASLGCLVALASSSAVWAATPETAAVSPAAPALASHRAVYDLALAKSTGAQSPATAHGRIAFDFAGSPCEGYVQNFRQFTELQPPDGPMRVSDMRSATYEDGDGHTFRFKVESRVDNGGVEDIDGRAAKSDDGALSVSLSRPHLAKLDLDQNVLFPTEHLRRILDAARAGQHTLGINVFDGSESGEKVFQTLTVIGNELATEPTEAAAQAPQLKGLRRWPVSVSYFDEKKKDSVPNYVLSFDLYENGISRALKLDYGDFVLSGEMTKLEFLPSKECPK
jgi:hypothetical protein